MILGGGRLAIDRMMAARAWVWLLLNYAPQPGQPISAVYPARNGLAMKTAKFATVAGLLVCAAGAVTPAPDPKGLSVSTPLRRRQSRMLTLEIPASAAVFNPLPCSTHHWPT
jgi:hypothetical protein